MTAENLHDHSDSPLYMMLRREINETYAEQPLDFNVAGLEAGEKLLGRAYTTNDTVVDVGSSSGKMIAEAALRTHAKTQIICVEPDAEAAEAYQRLSDEYRHRVTFIQASGEQTTLGDNSVQGATLHNVIFRARNAATMLLELQRVVEPGGFIAISTNARGHAYYRHEFERQVAEQVVHITGVPFRIPKPPAEGSYLEDLPSLFQHIGDLEIVDELYVSQDTKAIITNGQAMQDYLESIRFSAANTDILPEHRFVWRRVVDILVGPYIQSQIGLAEFANTVSGRATEPYFADPIRRGMYVLRNTKK